MTKAKQHLNKPEIAQKIYNDFIHWTKIQGSSWNLHLVYMNGKASHFMDPDTDTAWIAFNYAWRLKHVEMKNHLSPHPRNKPVFNQSHAIPSDKGRSSMTRLTVINKRLKNK